MVSNVPISSGTTTNTTNTKDADLKFNNRVTFSSSTDYAKPYFQTNYALTNNIGFKAEDGTYISAMASGFYNGVNEVSLAPMPYLQNVGYPTFDPVLRGLVVSVGGSVGTDPKKGWVSNVSISKNIGLANMERGSLKKSALGDETKLDGHTIDANLGYKWAGEFNSASKIQSANTELGVFGYRKVYDKCREFNFNSLGGYAKISDNNIFMKAQLGFDPMDPKIKLNGGVSLGFFFNSK